MNFTPDELQRIYEALDAQRVCTWSQEVAHECVDLMNKIEPFLSPASGSTGEACVSGETKA